MADPRAHGPGAAPTRAGLGWVRGAGTPLVGVQRWKTFGQDSTRRHAFGRGVPRGAVGPSLARMLTQSTYNRALTVFCLETGGVWTRLGHTHHGGACLPCFLPKRAARTVSLLCPAGRQWTNSGCRTFKDATGFQRTNRAESRSDSHFPSDFALRLWYDVRNQP